MDDDLTPFAYGAIYGTRAWEIDTDGYLTGIIYQSRWTPGENVATCRAVLEEVLYSHGPQPVRRPIRLDEPGIEITPGHMLACGPAGGNGMGGCGFHGFLEGSNDYGANGRRISGVVALYGRGVRGTKGGRFMKARIVAIYVPRNLIVKPLRKDADPLHALRHRINDPLLPRLCCTTPMSSSPRLTPDLYRRLRENYRGVPFYDSWDDMVQQHPTTAPMPPTPKKEQP